MARQRLCLGVDIGASSIKLCQLRRAQGGYVVERFATAPLAQETIVDGAVMNTASLVETLSRLIKDHKIKNRRTALSVSGSSVIIKKIPLPKMTQDELQVSIQYEAGQFIPFAIEDVYLDAQIVKDPQASAQEMDVILVAAKKDMVSDYVSVLTESGLDPVICDVDAFAIENAFLNGYKNTQDCVALVNMGASKTNINVLMAGVSVFTRDLSLGGNNYTEEIQKSFKVSFEEAERLKMACGRASERGTSPMPDVDAAIAETHRLIITEIGHSLDFFVASANHTAPQALYLSGGCANMASLVKAISSQLQIQTHVQNPFAAMADGAVPRSTLEAMAPASAVAVGLALRALGDS